MINNNPLIAIIVPCYQQSDFLDECLNSVLNQSFSNWECIIINDGSKDDTELIAKKWKKKDNRFKYIYTENGGVCRARNIGIENTLAKYILPLDADDYVSDNFLELSYKKIIENETIKVVYGKVKRFGKIDDILIVPEFSLRAMAEDNIISCTALYRKVDWTRCKGYDISMKQGMEDWEFWINMLKDGGAVAKVNGMILFYRIKKLSRNTSMGDTNRESLKKYLSIKHAEFFVNQLGSTIDLYSYKVAYLKINNNVIVKTIRRIVKCLVRQ